MLAQVCAGMLPSLGQFNLYCIRIDPPMHSKQQIAVQNRCHAWPTHHKFSLFRSPLPSFLVVDATGGVTPFASPATVISYLRDCAIRGETQDFPARTDFLDSRYTHYGPHCALNCIWISRSNSYKFPPVALARDHAHRIRCSSISSIRNWKKYGWDLTRCMLLLYRCRLHGDYKVCSTSCYFRSDNQNFEYMGE